MGTKLPTKVMLRQTLVLMQRIFLNNVRKVGRLVLSRTSCYLLEEHWPYKVGPLVLPVRLHGTASTLAG
jgi:hypothetical protein